MWECKKCGAKNFGNTNFCPNCGTRKGGTGTKRIDGMNAVFIAAIAIVVVCAIVVAFNSARKTPPETVVVTEYVASTPMLAPTSAPLPEPTPEPILESTPEPTLSPVISHRDFHSTGKTVSNKGEAIEYPAEIDFYSEPFSATVKASRSNGSIYIMPKPKSGNGNLGTVRNGTVVTIWATRNGCYFFETPDGVMGWNGTQFFVVG